MPVSLGPVVGKVGGGVEVESINIDHPNSSSGITDVVTVPVPAGETYNVVLVIFSGTGTSTSPSNTPLARIGDSEWARYNQSYSAGIHYVVTGPTVIQSNRQGSTATTTSGFTGVVYYWPAD